MNGLLTASLRTPVSAVSVRTRMTLQPIRIAVAGASGPHARKAWAPILRQLQASGRVEVVLATELVGKDADLRHLYGDTVEILLTEPFVNHSMPVKFAERLRAAIRRLDVDAVIVATEPLSHLSYMEVLVPLKVHILLDKPIVAFEQVSNDPAQAARVLSEYERLVDLHRQSPSQVIAVAVQRRHHIGFSAVRQFVDEAAAEFGCPVTYMFSSHTDGQFRSPAEMEELLYHGTRQGYGKLFHSGMHLVDVQSTMIESAAETADFSYNALSTIAHSLRPSGFTKLVPRHALESIFGVEASAGGDFVGHGELDLIASTSFEASGETTTLVQLDLAHNSVSGRNWVKANPDLYKGNGRQKHEHHIIRQGPFQTIYVDTCQAKHMHDLNTDEDFEYGGNNHFDVAVFRNAGTWSTPTEALLRFGAADLAATHGLSSGRLLNSVAKDQALLDFIDTISTPGHRHPSLLEDHWLTSAWMACIAESMASNRVITIKIPSDEGSS